VLSPPPRLTVPKRSGEGISGKRGKAKKEKEGGDKSKANFSSGQFLNNDNLIFLAWRMMKVLVFNVFLTCYAPTLPD